MEDYLSKLNEQQRAAVEYCEGPQLVIAGAGSGKTRVLTYKIVHLLVQGYEPWRILALTFTNKAAREMRERIEQLVGHKTASRLWMGTFHSIFARILRYNADKIGYKSDFTIYDTTDSKSLIKMIIKDMGLDDKVYKVSTVLNEISNAKNALVGPAEYEADPNIREADRRARRPRMYEVYAGYCARCRVADAMDFDDLLFNTYLLLKNNPDICNHYREFFKYILVDEYQDTNYAQHAIVSLLTNDVGGCERLCVVGDDAQSIYSFRGANIRNILNLRNAYPSLKIFKLEQNYRSTQNIINAANSLIAKNKWQMQKNVFSRNDEGRLIELTRSYSDFDEAYMVSNRISQLHIDTSDNYDDFAVLYRTNAQSRVLEEALRKRNIPYRIYGGTSFYQRKEVKDVLAYFRLSVNPGDDEALRRIINYPARGIGETTVRKLIAAAISANVSLWQVVSSPTDYGVDINRGTATRIQNFAALINKFIKLNTEGTSALEVARTIISETGILASFLHDHTPESISKQENIDELINGVQQFETERIEEAGDVAPTLTNFLAEVSLATDQDKDDETPAPKVTLMTIHAAKGLEFGNVFIVGVEEDLLPSAMSINSAQEIEEERRLLYVAITRAKRFCMISYASNRFRNGSVAGTRPSRFLNDIDSRYIKKVYGTGNSTGEINIRSSFHSQRPSNKIYDQGVEDNRVPNPPRVVSTFSNPLRNISQKSDKTADGFSIHNVGELETGMRIEHAIFGAGTIIDIDTSMADAKIKVRFDNIEIKTLLLKFAKFKISAQ